jgi:hypothetical protein
MGVMSFNMVGVFLMIEQFFSPLFGEKSASESACKFPIFLFSSAATNLRGTSKRQLPLPCVAIPFVEQGNYRIFQINMIRRGGDKPSSRYQCGKQPRAKGRGANKCSTDSALTIKSNGFLFRFCKIFSSAGSTSNLPFRQVELVISF